MAKCNKWPSEYQANWKKWPSVIITKFVYKVSKWINGQMPRLANWILSKVEKVAKCNDDHLAIRKTNFTIFALGHFYHLATDCIWPFINLAIEIRISSFLHFAVFSLGLLLHLAIYSLGHLKDEFHFFCTWPLFSLGHWLHLAIYSLGH